MKPSSIHQQDWDKYLYLFLLAYRSFIHKTMPETPAYIVFGREMGLSCELEFDTTPGEDIAGKDYVLDLKIKISDIHNRVCSNIQNASDIKKYYDIQRLHEGNLVWLYNSRLTPKAANLLGWSLQSFEKDK